MNKVTKGVYCLTSPSGKRYVGIGVGRDGIEGRWKSYIRLDCKGQLRLYNALKKYGPKNFKYEIILETSDGENAKRSEMYLIDVWNLQDDRYGYNISPGGEAFNLGRRRTDEQKKIHSLFMTGKKHSKEQIVKQVKAQTGKKHPEEVIKNMRILGLKKAKMRTFQNIKTGETVVCSLHEGMRRYGFYSNICFRKSSKGWRLINE